ncbi:hypothetical protein [Cutibacterium porci]|nr:hypothetical protein [Cutibacterium porci]
MNRVRFLASRLVQTLAVLVVIIFITFAIFEFSPLIQLSWHAVSRAPQRI